MTALFGARYSRLDMNRLQIHAHTTWHQLDRVSGRGISRRAAIGMEVAPSRRPVRGEFLSVVLFGYALPLVWVIGIVVDYLRHAR